MCRRASLILAAVILGLPGGTLHARAELTPGDIAIIGFNFSGTDEFAFVAMTNLAAGETISFTDNGWLAAGGFRSGEGEMNYTVPTSGLVRGSIVNPTVSAIALSISGDQIIAFQGTQTTPRFLYALNSEDVGWQADATNAASSTLPAGLTHGHSAVALREVDNAVFNTAVLSSGTRDQWLAAIGDTNNWSGSDSTRQAMPTGYLRVTGPGASHSPPVLNLTPPGTNRTAVPANPVTFLVTATEPDGDPLSLWATNLPTGAAFPHVTGSSPLTNTFDWTPVLTGTQTVRFLASDVDGTCSLDVLIVAIPPSAAPSYPLWINEFHYDNLGADADEGVEVAGVAGTDLTRYAIHFYNGGDARRYGQMALAGTVDDEGQRYGAVWFDWPGIQNGSPDGLALVADGTNVVAFVSYEGSFQGADGPCAGMDASDVGVQESDTNAVGFSLQLRGVGSGPAAFRWSGPLPHSRGSLNSDQTLALGGTFIVVQ